MPRLTRAQLLAEVEALRGSLAKETARRKRLERKLARETARCEGENARLREEREAHNRELTEAHRAADGDRRGAEGDQPLGLRAGARVRDDRRERRPAVRRRPGVPLPLRR